MKQIKAANHNKYILFAHVVFVTKYRKALFVKAHLQDMEEIFQQICHQFEIELTEFNGERDHVHLLISYPPKIALSILVNRLKGISSIKLREKYRDIRSQYRKQVLWSAGYFVSSCGGAPLEIIKKYIENQQTPD